MDMKSAFDAFQKKDYDTAEKLCLDIINVQPDHADSLHILGVIYNHRNNYKLSIEYLERASKVMPDNAEIWYNLSISYQSLKQYNKALEFADHALSLDKDLIRAYTCKGACFTALKQWNDLGKLFIEFSQMWPRSKEGLEYLAAGVTAAQNYILSEALCNVLLEIDSTLPNTLLNRAIVRYNLGKHRECIQDAIAAQTIDNTKGWQPMGAAYQALKEHDMAIACYNRSLKIDPNCYNTWANLCSTHTDLDQYDDAIKDADRAIEISPNEDQAYNNRGVVHLIINDCLKADADFSKAISLNPSNMSARYNMSICKIKQNKWAEGWAFSESRLDLHEPRREKLYIKDIPVWSGIENLSGKTIGVLHEQGYGDTILFIRYCKWLKNLGARVIAMVPAQLVDFIMTMDSVDDCGSTTDMFKDQLDYQVGMMSLPHCMYPNFLHQIQEGAYLKSIESKRVEWAEKIPIKHKLQIAIAWGGNPKHSNNRHRNIPLSAISPLFKLPADFICVQVNPITLEEQSIIDKSHNLWIPSPEIKDFNDTAAIIDQCDLTISVDTSVLHVAGALGKPAFGLLPKSGCWRWGPNDWLHCPWYDSVKLFRQQNFKDWSPVVKDVAWNILQKL